MHFFFPQNSFVGVSVDSLFSLGSQLTEKKKSAADDGYKRVQSLAYGIREFLMIW